MIPIRIQKYESLDGEVFRLYRRADGSFGLFVSSLPWIPHEIRGKRFTDAYVVLVRRCDYLAKKSSAWRDRYAFCAR